MTKLSSIPGIGASALELLEAVGFFDVEALAKADPDHLVAELTRANAMLKITKRPPGRANIGKWIVAAREECGLEHEPAVEATAAAAAIAEPVNYELAPDVVAMLATAPFAIPLPARFLVEQRLAVGDIPPALLLNRYSGDLEVRVEERFPGVKPARVVQPSGDVMIADTAPSRLEIDVSKVKSIEEFASNTKRVSTSARTEPRDERVALIRGPLAATNAGRDPKSRRYIRGVLHSHPFGMYLGALVTLLAMGFFPIGVIAGFLLPLSDLLPLYFGWVSGWWLVFPASLPILGIAYLIWGMGGSCRICGQKQFLPKACLKNSKAHHIRGLGHIIPVCLHMLLFKWFRCTYCGTPVRLKK
jgi:hypothetical protein